MLTASTIPIELQVIACVVPAAQFSPPFGLVTVTEPGTTQAPFNCEPELRPRLLSAYMYTFFGPPHATEVNVVGTVSVMFWPDPAAEAMPTLILHCEFDSVMAVPITAP